MQNNLLNQISQLRLTAFGQALEQQEAQPNHYTDLSFNERLSLLFDSELLDREQRKIQRLIKQAKFRLGADVEQIDYRAGRGLERSKIRSILEGHWLDHNQNLIFTGSTGCGKTYLGCAIGHHFCQQGISVRYFRLKSLQ